MGRYSERKRLLKRPLWNTKRPEFAKHIGSEIEEARRIENENLAIFDGIKECTGESCKDLLRGMNLGYLITDKKRRRD